MTSSSIQPIDQPPDQLPDQPVEPAVESIVQLGHPVLRQVAAPVEDAADPQVQQLIEALMAACQRANGVGIAAPQLGRSLRLLIVASRPNQRYPDAPEMAPTALINPRLVAHSEVQVKGWEGCLSVPDWRAQVPRYRQIEIEYLDQTGTLQRRVWQDFVARIFQHEADHLDGLVFLDRLEGSADLLSESAYRRTVLGSAEP